MTTKNMTKEEALDTIRRAEECAKREAQQAQLSSFAQAIPAPYPSGPPPLQCGKLQGPTEDTYVLFTRYGAQGLYGGGGVNVHHVFASAPEFMTFAEGVRKLQVETA